jgi:excisionase family DNA binding protein
VHTPVMKKNARGHLKESSSMLRTGEACRILCVHSNTLRRWSKQGIIKAYRIGPRGDRRFRREDIAALLIEKTKDSGKDRIKLSQQ